MVLRISLIGLCTLFLLCNQNCSKEKYPYDAAGLTYKGKLNFKNEFKTDGLYISSNNEYKVFNYFFINGSFYHVGISSNEINENCYQINDREIPYAWGYFIIEGDTLKVQRLDPSSRERYGKFMVEERWAKITSDTSLHFFRKITPEKETVTLDELYYFHPCTNKPDSINILMQ